MDAASSTLPWLLLLLLLPGPLRRLVRSGIARRFHMEARLHCSRDRPFRPRLFIPGPRVRSLAGRCNGYILQTCCAYVKRDFSRERFEGFDRSASCAVSKKMSRISVLIVYSNLSLLEMYAFSPRYFIFCVYDTHHSLPSSFFLYVFIIFFIMHVH